MPWVTGEYSIAVFQQCRDQTMKTDFRRTKVTTGLMLSTLRKKKELIHDASRQESLDWTVSSNHPPTCHTHKHSGPIRLKSTENIKGQKYTIWIVFMCRWGVMNGLRVSWLASKHSDLILTTLPTFMNNNLWTKVSESVLRCGSNNTHVITSKVVCAIFC